MTCTYSSFPEIKKRKVTTLQVNLGYKCNQACAHCHVDASPSRNEMMDDTNISLIAKALKLYDFESLDITGGAPELHPKFCDVVLNAKQQGLEVIDRCNLTILLEPGYENLANFLAENNVKVVASLPCYLESNVDIQRGKGVFSKSIEAIRMLNKLGYASNGSQLELDLVYNPQGAVLPPSQIKLEKDFQRELSDRYGIYFNKLLVLTNMPIKRFANYLKLNGQLDEYLELLRNNFNPLTLSSLMCTNTLSVDWEGGLYDCDFNQQLGMKINSKQKTLKDLLLEKNEFNGMLIKTGEHCYGCSAGNGSSCGGSLIEI